MHCFEAFGRSLVNRIVDPVQLGHAQALADLNEQGGVEGGLRREAVEAEEILDVEVLADHLDRLLVAQVHHVLDHHDTEHDTRVYVQRPVLWLLSWLR